MERYLKSIEIAGLKVTDVNTATGTYTAEADTPKGVLRIYGGKNGEAWIAKPNGTHKYLIEKTPAQIGAVLNRHLIIISEVTPTKPGRAA